MPNPSQLHQDIVLDVAGVLKSYVKLHKLGNVIIAPFDVYLDENNLLVPDIIFVSVDRAHILDGKKANGVPNLVVEVISRANYKKKCVEKMQQYEKFGVAEYWEIRPNKKQCSIFTLQNGQYELFAEAKKKGNIQSLALPDLVLNFGRYF
jgi:Uma2 family endonuclease